MPRVMATGSRVQGDVMRFLRGSALAAAIRGGIYRAGLRPADSRAEDITVAFTAGLPGEIERGVVTLNIFVPDIVAGSGRVMPDGARCEALERAAADWVETLTCGACGGYRFALQSAIRTEPDAAAGQHFVAVRLRYDLYE